MPLSHCLPFLLLPRAAHPALRLVPGAVVSVPCHHSGAVSRHCPAVLLALSCAGLFCAGAMPEAHLCCAMMAVLCQVVLYQSQCNTLLVLSHAMLSTGGCACWCHSVPCQQVLTAPCAHRCVHGLCLPLDALSYSCQCHEGYQGALCNQPAEPPDPCRHQPCVHGHCHLTPGGQPTCECHDGYTGALCDQGRC